MYIFYTYSVILHLYTLNEEILYNDYIININIYNIWIVGINLKDQQHGITDKKIINGITNDFILKELQLLNEHQRNTNIDLY